MQPQRLVLLASLLFAAAIVTLLLAIPVLVTAEERWNIVFVSEIVRLARTIFVVALLHAFALGLPLFLILQLWGRIGIASCALGGFLIGALPAGMLVWTSMIGVQNASSGGKATVINGVLTTSGWIEFAYTTGFMGLFGVAGGLAFWVAMRLSGQIAGVSNAREAQSDRLRARSRSIVPVAAVLTCAILLLPAVVKDNSCHNLFRDGRTSIGPQVFAEVKLSAEDWPALSQIFTDFGAAHALSLRSDQEIRDGNIMWRDLNLCNEDGINIDSVDNAWPARTKSPLADQGVTLRVFALGSDDDWKPLARDLLSRIGTTWPGRTTFRGPDGQVIPFEEALEGRP